MVDESKFGPSILHRYPYKLVLGLVLLLFFCVHLSIAAEEQHKAIRRGTSASTSGGSGVEAGNLYALVVGVSKYKDSRIPPLNFADKDAQSFARFLKSQTGLFKDVHVKELVNENATQKALHTELIYGLRKAGKDDTVIVFFSGHGTDDPKNPGEYFFLPHDVDAEFVAVGGIHMNRQWFTDKLDCKRVLIIVDACHAGGFSDRGTKRLVPSMDKLLAQFKESEGRVFITSSRADELSKEEKDKGHSLFTYYLLEGLSGKAAIGENGIITLQALYDYVYQKTKKASGGFQSPQWAGRIVGTFPLAMSRPLFDSRPEVQPERPKRVPQKVRGVTETEILIGQWGPQTGPAAIWGAVGRATGVYFELINSEGGINGRKIKYFLRDDAYQPSKTRAVAKEFVEGIGVFAVVGGVGTSCGMAVRDYLKKNKVPWISPASGSSHWISPFNKYIFSCFPQYQHEAYLIAQYVTEQMVKKNLGFVYQNDEFGREGLGGVKRYLSSKGLKLIAEVPVELTDTDLKTHALKLKDSGAEVAILWALPKTAAIMVGVAKMIGYEPQWVACSTLSDPEMFFKITKGLWKGVMYTNFVDMESPMVKKYLDAQKKWAPNESYTGYYYLQGFYFAEPLVEGLRRCGRDLNVDNFIRAMESINKWNTVWGSNLTFTENDHQGCKSVFIEKCGENGQRIRVSDWLVYPER